MLILAKIVKVEVTRTMCIIRWLITLEMEFTCRGASLNETFELWLTAA